ncbi:MAG: sodium-dependent transporter [Gammaproteobacteria bacterium]|jgi:NSS family neurotransmitter:Na+ symporter
MARKSIHGEWSSRWIFVLAATGSAVGLGNIWKFPYMAGENGGGAFVLIYLACIALLGIPVMMAEVLIGRRGRQSPINTMITIAKEEGANWHWRWLGWSGVLAGFLILSYYSVIAGWTLAYILESIDGTFTGLDGDAVANVFDSLVGNAGALIFWHSLFMLLTMVVVARGVQQGLEKAIRFLMPALFVLLVIMVGYALSTDAFGKGFAFMFTPDFSKITTEGILKAMGQAFFTLSLGMGAIMIYGSYMPHDASIAGTSITVALADTAVALLAGIAIFPIVFANGLEPGAGPGLVFVTLPIAFGHMPGGAFFGTVFFVLLAFAAWSSSISLIEPFVAWLVENKGMTRNHASIVSGLITWVAGLGTVFSFNYWKDIKLFGKTYFDLLDFLTSNIMLPLGGLLIGVFAAWVIKKQSSVEELGMGDGLAYQVWSILVRYVTPVGVGLIFLKSIGVI